jgi:hypothetical protein
MNYFVFVVCGGKEFIEELNFSLKFLRYFSKFPIIVLTDTSRNEIKIEHNQIIDVQTPKQYTNHQAHLFLETGLPNFVQMNDDDIYCYIDSDIVAINDDINKVFDEYEFPIRFAKDHCTIDYFSAGIMNCGCKNEFDLIESQFHFMQSYYPKYNQENEVIRSDHEKLKEWFIKVRNNPFSDKLEGIRYLFKRYLWLKNKIKQKNNFIFDKNDRCWYNSSGDLLDYDYNYYKKQLWKKHDIRFINNRWENRNGNELVPAYPYCHHLREHILKNYKISIPSNWQHYNGGVFLFKKESKDFMNLWHKNMLFEFEHKNKRIYDDQGTLIAAVWESGIQDQKPMSIKYNFITDPENKDVRFDSDLGYTFNNFKTKFKPAFLHIYHDWGNLEWDIWQSVIKLGKEKGIL